MDGLPFLPGNTFKDPTQVKFHVSQTLGYKNGYAIINRPETGIGGTQLPRNCLSEKELDDLAMFNPALTYGQAKPKNQVTFLPGHAAWDKKVLKFHAFFKETVHESPNECYCVRPVDIYYFLEDNSIMVNEPHIENSGMPQGKLINRQRLPKNDQGDIWHWKDFNLGINFTFYGRCLHIINCDKFTKDFLEEEGIVLNEPESIPPDPYLTKRAEDSARVLHTTRSSFDKLKQFIELDHKVLKFFCIWDDSDSMFGEKRPFILHYYLVDDTLEVREVHKANNGRDPFSVLIGRHRIPKDRYNIPPSFPSGAMEATEYEIDEYFSPKDFQIGKTVDIYGRSFMIYDCDNFTRGFYSKNFGIMNSTPIDVSEITKDLPKMEISAYNNFGTLKDSLQTCTTLLPRVPKRDFIKLMENDHKELRFEAMMVPGCKDAMRPEDRGRRFIFTYRLSDDTIVIYEPPVKNSGVIGGRFLERCRIAKPGSTMNNPSFYGPEDFFIGAIVEAFKHRFVIVNVDEHVLNYIEGHKPQFSDYTYSSVKTKVDENTAQKQMEDENARKLLRRPGDLDSIVNHISSLLKKIVFTDKYTIFEIFLKYDTDRTGYFDIKNLKDFCKHYHLSTDDDIMQALICKMTKDQKGHVSLEDFRNFIES